MSSAAGGGHGGRASARGDAPAGPSSVTTHERTRVRAALEHYATRGSFHSFSEVAARGGKAEYQFLWFRDVRFRVVFDEGKRTLTFVDLLPGVTPRSEMDRHFRAFIREHTDITLPPHRRVDPDDLAMSVTNRGGAVSLVFTFRTDDTAVAVRKAVHLVHDVLQDFLNDGRYVQYNIDHFNLNPESAT
jgi:hypothetical protein